ncbi:MAG: lactate utilization protein [Deltaproteobacteria bacterium CG03_land_8_20_14_0_80_45_14]|nr:MAG: lactate utilization protein [Deltaproteobacteria bacterium CG03_land_8_20_14_0_80_45_14]
MEQLEQWFRQKQVERTIQALKKNNFEALYVPDAKVALEEVMKRIPDGATVGVGGSVTLAQIGLLDALKNRKIQLIWPLQQARSDEERLELFRKSFSSDVFLSSTNAVTEDGRLFNVDATGNRVGAMFIGPKKTIIICGVNKIVKDLEAAEKRVREWTAPQNAKRLGKKTPCVETGVCSDCSSPDRICNIYVTLAKKPARTEVIVILVGENLGI